MSQRQDRIAAELVSIQERAGGLLLPADVVGFARDPSTELHHVFTWDNDEAAEKFRLDQARQVIRAHVVIIGSDPTPVRAQVSLSTDRGNGGGYRAMVTVLADAEQNATMVRDALRELLRTKHKYERLSQLREIWSAIESATRAENDRTEATATG